MHNLARFQVLATFFLSVFCFHQAMIAQVGTPVIFLLPALAPVLLLLKRGN